MRTRHALVAFLILAGCGGESPHAGGADAAADAGERDATTDAHASDGGNADDDAGDPDGGPDAATSDGGGGDDAGMLDGGDDDDAGGPDASVDPCIPAPEMCDGQDNDCDGVRDEAEDLDVGTCGIGQCLRSGTCDDGVVSCVPGAPAPDEPDLLYEDANCDGIDGDASLAIFVDTASGDDAGPGSIDQPMRTIQAAVDAAFLEGKDVYVSEGVYDESVVLANGVGLYGGFAAAEGWTRAPDAVSEISGGAIAITGDGIDTQTALQLLTIRSADAVDPGASSYGIFLTTSTGVSLTRVTIEAGAGARGVDGADGSVGADGEDGGPGEPGCENGDDNLCDHCEQPGGGDPGASLCGRTGGIGGVPGLECDCGDTGGDGAGGTNGGPGGCGCGGGNGTRGDDGISGGPGTDGDGGLAFGLADPSGYLAANGTDGTDGRGGNGGGGGGGGSGGSDDCNSYGSSGGGGGAGGCGGARGTLGTGGGGSFAVYLSASTLDVIASTFSTRSGGEGGIGGVGGQGGAAGSGGPAGQYGGGGAQDDAGMGARGGQGGRGGNAGHGGGGGGGPSIVVVCSDSSTVTLDVDSTLEPGTGGAGGASLGHAGEPGLAAASHGC